MTSLLESIAAEARKGDMAIDEAAYRTAGAAMDRPVLLGSGSLTASLGFFGRDPGRREIELGEPFVGKGGQLVRGALFRAAGGSGTPTVEESIEAGRTVFWGNTVPYKPLGNKAWSTTVKRRFLPFIYELLVAEWQGHTLITLGNQAIEWFGLAEPKNKPVIKEYWKRQDRYEGRLQVRLGEKDFLLYPLPHPSPLNATWHAKFPTLLRRRLEELGWCG